MIADFIENSRPIIVYISGILALVVSISTIITFVVGKDSRKKKTMLIVSVVLVAVAVCVLTILNEKEEEESSMSIEIEKQDSIVAGNNPFIPPSPPVIKKNKRIIELVKEARSIKDKYIAGALDQFREAYELLPETQKRKTFIDSIGGFMTSKTQVNYYNEFFKSLNY